MPTLQAKIITYFKENTGASLTTSELARRLHVETPDRRRLRRSLKELTDKGTLVVSTRGRRFSLAKAAMPKQQAHDKPITPEITQTVQESIANIIEELSLPTDFPAKVLHEAEAIDDVILESELKKRRDLRGHVTVTIDGETARDFDDAISIENIGKDRIRLRVSIADVSHYVRPGTAIDREAFARGTSVYFPNRVLPMLPEKLSNNLCSLVPEKDRLSFTAEIDFDKKGQVVRTEFYKSIIRSAYRLTYTQVAQALVAKDREVRHELRHILPHLELMETLFDRLRKSRLARGSLDFDLPEPLFVMDLEESRIDTIVKAERTRAHMMIEEFMIAANEAVATFITDQEVPGIYRVHESPAPDKLKDLQSALHNLGYPLKVSKKSTNPKALAAVISKAQGQPESRLINTLLLRSLAKAVYSVQNQGHFGLASDYETHFTSPIRRYPDLIIHRILAELLDSNANQPRHSSKKKRRGANSSFDIRKLERMAEHCSIRERAAMEAEWASRDLLQTIFMADHVGEIYAGIIAGVTKFGLFVELTKYFVQGLLHMRNLGDDYYIFLESSHTLVGRRTKKKFRIGDSLRIRVKKIDVDKRWIDFELAPEE